MGSKTAAIISDVSEQMQQDGITPDLHTYNLVIFG